MIKIAALTNGALLGLSFEDADEYRRFRSAVEQNAPHMEPYKSWTGRELHVRPAAVSAYGKREAFE